MPQFTAMAAATGWLKRHKAATSANHHSENDLRLEQDLLNAGYKMLVEDAIDEIAVLEYSCGHHGVLLTLESGVQLHLPVEQHEHH